MKLPDKNKKSFKASPTTGSESENCGRDPSDSPRKSTWPFFLNWVIPYQGGCSQFVISSRDFDSSICDWKSKFSFLGKYHLFRIESFRVDLRCVHRFQLLKVCNQFVTLPNYTRVQRVSEEQYRKDFLSKLMDSDWSSAVIGWYSTNEPNGITGHLNGCPKRLS